MAVIPQGRLALCIFWKVRIPKERKQQPVSLCVFRFLSKGREGGVVGISTERSGRACCCQDEFTLAASLGHHKKSIGDDPWPWPLKRLYFAMTPKVQNKGDIYSKVTFILEKYMIFWEFESERSTVFQRYLKLFRLAKFPHRQMIKITFTSKRSSFFLAQNIFTVWNLLVPITYRMQKKPCPI